MSELKLSGIMPPLTTPFDEDGRVDYGALAENVGRYNEVGLTGYVALGSNGEAVHLTLQEQIDVIRTIKKTARSDRTLIAGVNELSTHAAIAAVARAADAGADAALVITPYYYKAAMSQEALLRHFTEVADRSPIPILIYNVPQNTGLVIEPATVASIAGHPRIVGIKDSAGNMSAISEIVRMSTSGFAVLIGNGGILYPGLLVGAVGAILAVACILPGPCVELMRSVKAGEYDRARELHNRIAPCSHIVTAGLGVAGLKTAMDMLGFVGGQPRPPLLQLTDAQKDKLRSVLVGSGFLG